LKVKTFFKKNYFSVFESKKVVENILSPEVESNNLSKILKPAVESKNSGIFSFHCKMLDR